MSRRFNLSAPLIVSVAALAVMVLLVLNQGPPLLMAALGPSGNDADPQGTLASLVDDHRDDFEVYQERFNGRSFFFKPQPWPPAPRTAPPPRPRIEEPIAPSPPPPDPTPAAPRVPPDYTGPKILFVVGDSVWFESDRNAGAAFKGLEVSVGEEKDGIRVIETNLPWSVKLGHEGGEYDVPIFERVDPFQGGTPTASTASKPRFPGLVDASNTTSRDEREAMEDEAAGAEDPDEATDDEAEVATANDDASSDEPPATVDGSEAAKAADAAVTDAAKTESETGMPTDVEATAPASTPPAATALRAAPGSTPTEVTPAPLMGPPTREESTASAPPAKVSGADAPAEKPKSEEIEKPAGDAVARKPVAAPRPTPQLRPQGGRPAPEQRQGGRPAPEQQAPAKPSGEPGAGDPGKPGKTDESDTSESGSKSSEEPSNAGPGKE